jgi:CubicO group peptidase (beta-lactamase class C family)
MRDFSPLRLERLRAALRRHIANGYTPGIVALVHHGGRQHVEALGTMGFDEAKPMARDTIFRLASMTKPVTAVAALILVEECRLRLDDPVEHWLPELANRRVLRAIDGPLDDTVPAQRAITLRDLLTFRAGYGEVGLFAPGCPLHQAQIAARLPLVDWIFGGTPDEFMRRVGALPLAHQPGARWLYHLACEITGVLVARVAGQPLSRFLQERIFAPLGMHDTGFWVPEAKLDRLPPCYATDFTTGARLVLDPARGGQMSRPPAFESGAGGLVSTVDDMAALGRALLPAGTRDGVRLLSRPTLDLMTSDQLTEAQKTASPFFPDFWADTSWGLGVGVVTARRDIAGAPGRFGWDGAFGTSWWVDPIEELVCVLMTQRRPDALAIPALTRDFITSTYQLIE